MRPTRARLIAATCALCAASLAGADSWDREYLVGEAVARGVQHALAPTSDGGALVFDELVAGEDLLLMRLDADGAVDWRVRVASTLDDKVRAVAQTPDGGFMIAGHASELLPISQSFVAKLDSGGVLAWETRFDGLDTRWINEILALDDGGCLTFGTTSTATGVTDRGFMARLDATGSVTWARTYEAAGSPGLNIPRARRMQGVGPTVLADGAYPAFLAVVDDTGRVLREGVIERDSFGPTQVHDLLVTPAGDIVVLGIAEAFDPCTFGQYESWLARIDTDDTLAWSVRTPDAWFTSILPTAVGFAAPGGFGPCDSGHHEGWTTWNLSGTLLSARSQPGGPSAGVASTSTIGVLAGPPGADPWGATSIRVRKVELDGSGCPTGVDVPVSVLPLALRWTPRPVLTLTDFVPRVISPAFVVTPFAITDAVSACGVAIPNSLRPPDEVPRLDVEQRGTGVTKISWIPAAGAASHEVYAGSLADRSFLARALDGGCGLTSTDHVDSTGMVSPSRWYVVAGRNAAGRGSLGTDSLGRERAISPPGCP